MKLKRKGAVVRSDARIIRERGPLAGGVLHCAACGQWFRGRFDEPARCDELWIYCARCPDIMVSQGYDTFMYSIDYASAGGVEIVHRIIEQNFRPCLTCGGAFRFDAPARCPLCWQPLGDEPYALLLAAENRRLHWSSRPLQVSDMRKWYNLITDQTQMYRDDEMIIENPSRAFLALLASTILNVQKPLAIRYPAACYLGYYAHAGIDELDDDLTEAQRTAIVEHMVTWWQVNHHRFL